MLLCAALPFPSSIFVNHHFFFVAVCQLFKWGRMKTCSSFVIYGPVFRRDFLCLCAESPKTFVTAITLVK